jgi:integrase
MRVRETMVSKVHEYLSCRRALGFALKIEGAQLLRFARYADQVDHQGPITTELAVRWAMLPKYADQGYWARRVDLVRRFAKHRMLFDPYTEIPPKGLLGHAYCRITPHIYSDQEIQALIAAAWKLGPLNGLKPHTYATLFGLLASTGLRISEALGLAQNDVDLQNGVLTIGESKFKKSRLVPLHPSAVIALRRYSEHRTQYHPKATSKAFFLTEHGTSLKYHTCLLTFHHLRGQLGWAGNGEKRPPRIHDMRHTFAVRRLLRWYQEGVEVGRMIPALATYLGHVKVSDTYWYLTAVPELMEVISQRFEHHFDSDYTGGVQ